jgi:ubiquinone/menaquinone biosynthesis C-methylase UbiE
MQKLTAAMKISGSVEICQRLGEISGGKILDVGTEQGEFISTLMKTLKDYGSFIGIDISEEDLEKARAKFREMPVEFKTMNAEKMDFHDDSFDTVCISHSIHHLENPEKVLIEMKRVLRPGGYLILQESFSDGEQSEDKLTSILIHHWHAKVDSFRGIPHFETLSRNQLRDLIGSMNMSNIEVFESKRYVKCLFCDDMKQCENPKDKDIIDFEIKGIDNLLEKMKDHPKYEDLFQEAVALRERVKETGSSPASLLFFICRK